MTKILSIFAIAILALASDMQAAGAAADYVITAVRPAVVPSPDIQFTGTPHRSGKQESWLEVEVDFQSNVAWTDELTFKYYILLGGKCLTGEVTHVNIPSGRDLHSVMYISPRTILRVLAGKTMTGASIENVAVQIVKQGAVVDTKSFKPAPNPQWWQSMQQVPNLVLNKNETPFQSLYWDRYEAIKSPSK